MIIFCNSLLEPENVDPDFEQEYQVARQAQIAVGLLSLETLQAGNPKKAVVRIKVQAKKTTAVYRGWMLTPLQYESLYQNLTERNIFLINSLDEYVHCHYFPSSYEIIKHKTPVSIAFKLKTKPDFDKIMELLRVFGDKPVLLKDYVKSEKYYWKEACFIASAADRQAVENVTNRFLELRGPYLNEGLVYRAFVELEYLNHPDSNSLPMAKEYRLFYLNNKLIDYANYWNEEGYSNEIPIFEAFNEIASRIKSNFFVMDIAKKKDGNWIIIELGDGQVSGLPEMLNVVIFYGRLKEKLASIHNKL